MQRIQGAVIAGGLLVMGCGTGSTTAYKMSTEALTRPPAEVAAPVAAAGAPAPQVPPRDLAGPGCDLRLFVEQLPGGGRTTHGVYAQSLGATVVERNKEGIVSAGVCIKRTGDPLNLPSGILIAHAKESSLKRFCSDDEAIASALLLPPDELESRDPRLVFPKVFVCSWDGTFHSARPFTVTLVAKPGASVADFVELARVYRNGDAMIGWNRSGDQRYSNVIVLPGGSMRTGMLAATHPPHLASMDLRIVPRSDSVTVGVETEVRDDRRRFLGVMSEAFGAAFDVALPDGSPERQSWDCLKKDLEHASQVIMRRVSAETIVSPSTCTPLVNAGAPTPLSDEYRKLKDRARDQAEMLKGQAFAEIARYRDELISAIPARTHDTLEKILTKALSPAQTALAKTCLLEIERPGSDKACLKNLEALSPVARQNVDNFRKAALRLDRQVTAALRTVDEARALADRLTDKAKRIARDPDQQAEIFNAFAKSVASHGDVFEPRRDNPPLLAGEQKVDMSYADSVQGFLLAPWNAVPIRITGDAEADLNAATLLPFMDVIGFRVQWGRSRFADFRGAAGFGYVRTKDDNGVEKSTALPNVSLGLGTFKVGAGYLIGGGDDIERKLRVRVLVGADLFKLIAGDNVEAL